MDNHEDGVDWSLTPAQKVLVSPSDTKASRAYAATGTAHPSPTADEDVSQYSAETGELASS